MEFANKGYLFFSMVCVFARVAKVHSGDDINMFSIAH